MVTAFFLIKGLLALVGFLLILVDVYLVWSREMSLGRRLRYWTLLLAAAFIFNASRIQAGDDQATLDTRAVQGMILALLLLAAGAVSLVEDRKTQSSHGSSRLRDNW